MNENLHLKKEKKNHKNKELSNPEIRNNIKDYTLYTRTIHKQRRRIQERTKIE